MKIVHMSDIHYTLNWMFNRGVLEKGIEQINELEPDIVVITGDLTEWGLELEFRGVKEYLKEIKQPCFIVPGNHDARYEGFKFFEKFFSKRDSRILAKRIDDILLIGLDSSEPDIDEGHIGREQLMWVEEQISSHHVDAIPMFFLHHHLIPVPNTGRERNVLVDAGEVLFKLKKSKVPLVLTGHRHMPWVWNLDGMVIASAGTISCERRSVPQSFNIIEVDRNKIQITKQNVLDGKRENMYDFALGKRR